MLRSATAPNASAAERDCPVHNATCITPKLHSRVAPEKVRSSTRPKNSMVNEEPSLI